MKLGRRCVCLACSHCSLHPRSMTKNTENEISSFQNLEVDRKIIESVRNLESVRKMKVRFGLAQKEPGGYLLEITRDSEELGTEPHDSQPTRSQCFVN